METIVQGLAASLFAAPMPPAGSAPAGSAPLGAGLAGLVGGFSSPDGTKSPKLNEFLRVLDASASRLGPELSDLPAPPDSLAEHADHVKAQPTDDYNGTLLLANMERLVFGGAAAVDDNGERTITVPVGGRISPVQRFVGSDASPSVDILSDLKPDASVLPTNKGQVVDPSGRTSLRDDGMDLPRQLGAQRFDAIQNEFLAPRLPVNKFITTAPLMAAGLADKTAIEPGLIALDENLPLIQTLSAANDRAASAITLSPVSEAAIKPAAQIVAAITSRGMDASIEVRLDPPELGRVTIDFEGRGGDIIRATVAADAPDTLELMRRNIDILQRELEKSGLDNIDLQFRERGPQPDTKFDDDPFAAGSQHDDAVGIEINDLPHTVAALSLDGRLDRLL